MKIKEIQNLIKFVAKSGAQEVKLEMEDVKITIKTGSAPSQIESGGLVQQIQAVPTPIVSQIPVQTTPIAQQEPPKNEEKTVQTTKTVKSEKKQGSESENKGDKKSSATKTTQEIKSDIVVQEIDIKTIVSFNKEYFEVKITDTLDLTKTEIDFYDGQGFNDSAYAQNNIDFFALDCKSDCWGNIHVRTNAIQIEQFRR